MNCKNLKDKLQDIHRIGIFMLGGIGNYLMLTPMVHALKDLKPDFNIILILSQSILKDVLKDEEYIYDTLSIEDYNRIRLIIELRKKRLDMTIASTGINPLKGSVLALLSGARYRIGEDIKGMGLFYNYKQSYRHDDHEVIGNLKLISPLEIGIDNNNTQLRFNLSQEDVRYAKSILGQAGVGNKDLVIGIHPGSEERLSFKRWSPEKFAEIADILSKQGKKIIFLGGVKENPLIRDIMDHMHSDAIDLSGKLTLRETAAVIKRCDLFISNDTGLMHIAAAFDVPLVAIFGPTMFHKTGPYGKGIKRVVRKEISCSPCYDYKIRRCKFELECLKSISVRDVLDAVEEVLRINEKV
ncbi:MAG: glycosyltransferase family 9 protein [Nitrospinota bacterium]